MTQRVLLIGAGGLGCPVASILAQAGPEAPARQLTLLDDDVVDPTNLHRQLLYGEADVGQLKVECAASALRRLAHETQTPITIVPRVLRLEPHNALELARQHDLLIEGADNLPTKFLAADAAGLAERPIVHAGVVRWTGWVKAVLPNTSACLRCLFEDLPRDRVETCAEAGVVGALVGVIGALQAGLVLRLSAGDTRAAESITHVDARNATARTARVKQRASCALCGTRHITSLTASRYTPVCVA